MAKLYEYEVIGRGSFPVDMLRYDSAWPASQESVVAMEYSRDLTRNPKENRRVMLRSYSKPTDARWQSFGWAVGHIRSM